MCQHENMPRFRERNQTLRCALSLSFAERIWPRMASHAASSSDARREKFPPTRDIPPSIAIVWPVRYSQPSAIRKVARLHNTYISPLRAMPPCTPRASAPPAPPPLAAGLSRSHAPLAGKGPGAMAFRRMPCGPHSCASDMVMTLSPAFDIALGTVKGPPFQIHVVRIEITDALFLPSIQRLPHASVT